MNLRKLVSFFPFSLPGFSVSFLNLWAFVHEIIKFILSHFVSCGNHSINVYDFIKWNPVSTLQYDFIQIGVNPPDTTGLLLVRATFLFLIRYKIFKIHFPWLLTLAYFP